MKPVKIAAVLYEQYHSINEKVGNINCGGCGVFAEKLFMLLTNLGFIPKLIVLTNSKEGMDIRIKDDEGDYGFTYITHIVVKLGNRYIDSLGIYKTIDEIRIKHNYSFRECYVNTKLTIERLKEWNADSSIWNRKFDRRHIKTIEEKLEKVYNKVKINLELIK